MSDDRLIELKLELAQQLAAIPLSDDDLVLLQKSLSRYSTFQQTMREFELANGDEPDTVFSVYREEE